MWMVKEGDVEFCSMISGALTDEAVRNGLIKKVDKRGNVGEPRKDKNGREDNKRTRTGNAFAYYRKTLWKREYGYLPSVPPATLPCTRRAVRVLVCTGPCQSTCPRLKGQRTEENRSQTKLLLITVARVVEIIGIKLGVGHSCWEQRKLTKEIPNIVTGMDWLSNYKAEIICHEKVVRIPLPDGKVLRVLGERPEEKAKLLMSAKASDKKQEEIVVVRDFPEVFPDDLSGLPPLWEIEFRIELTPGATPVAKSPYRLAPSELEELSGQLKEL
ncbi:hypothetical protein Tco_1057807 [Tanacetum coccineum]|uniref:Reverse transcriptase domain-containing protein n=1 Tax=Tanacetum coccineum TaxID=301880 RepID=A0ABQ5H6F2_9ASTR